MNARAFAALLPLLLVACHRKADQSESPPPDVLTQVLATTTEAPLEVRGTVEAGSRLRLGFKLPGVLAKVLVKQGDQVRKGQLLAQLDQADALGQVRAAKARRYKAGLDWQRSLRLEKVGALSSSAKDDAVNARDVADANLTMALETLNRTKLVSPVDGKVAQRLAEPGETVAAGNPILLVDGTERPIVKVGVTDRDLPRLQVGQTVALQMEDGSPSFSGAVSALGPTPNAADGLYPVEIQFDKANLQLGTLVRVRFDGAKSEASLRIPLSAMVRRQDKNWVFVVEGDEKHAIVHQRAVDPERSEGKEIVIRSGLKDGERIVTEGSYFLQDAQAVHLLP